MELQGLLPVPTAPYYDLRVSELYTKMQRIRSPAWCRPCKSKKSRHDCDLAEKVMAIGDPVTRLANGPQLKDFERWFLSDSFIFLHFLLVWYGVSRYETLVISDQFLVLSDDGIMGWMSFSLAGSVPVSRASHWRAWICKFGCNQLTVLRRWAYLDHYYFLSSFYHSLSSIRKEIEFAWINRPHFR